MVRDTQTDYWNDSCATAELEYAVARGATGATSNPIIVLEVLRKEKAYWMPRTREITLANPTWTETDIMWAVIDAIAIEELQKRIPDFGRAYGPDGLALDEFDKFGATVRTLRGFIKSYHDLLGAIRDEVLPDPDIRPG